MSVVQRKDSKYYWLNLERPGRRVLRESTKIPVAAATPDQVKTQKLLAQQVYAVRMSELARHRHGLSVAPEMRFLAWAEWYAEHKTSQKASANRERSALRHLRSFFAKSTLGAIDRDLVSEYLTWRTATVDASTANREVDVLKDMLTTAVPKYLAVSPLLGMKRLRVKRRGMRILTLAEFRRLKTAIQKTTILKLEPVEGWALFVVAVDTFMRLGDLVALTPDQVYRDHIHVEDPKIGPYDVTLSPRARRALEALRRRQPTVPWVFPTLHKSLRLLKGPSQAAELQAVRFFTEACALAGVPHGRAVRGVTFHSLRHTGATRFMATGGSLRDLMQQGGWSDLESVMRYAHPSDELLAAVRRMSRL